MEIFLSPAIFIFAFPLLWCAIVFLASRIGGWGHLAQHYSYDGEIKGDIKTWRSLSFIRFHFMTSGYGGVLTFGGTKQYLYISVFKIYFAGHPPLRIPIKDLTLEPKASLFLQGGYLRAAQAPHIKIAMRRKDIDWLISIAGDLPPHK